MPDPNPVENATRKSTPPPVPPPSGTPETLKDRQTGAGALVGPALQPQQPLARIGRFEVRRLLGEGAFARVYLGFDPELEREVAIKVPKVEALTPEFRDTFLRENRLAAIVQHQNVCQIYDVGTCDGLPYIVMRVVHGTLAGLLKRLPGPMPPRNAVAIARKLALGLSAAHAQKVIHRDLKPANVLYDEANREVLIADFGLARFADQASDASNGVPKGTPAYMAPEQARGQAAVVGPLSDVYALGVMLYEMLTGRVPFTGTVWEVLIAHNEQAPVPPSTMRPGLDPRLDTLCLKALAKHPADRYPSARAFASALADYLRTCDQPGAPRRPAEVGREHAGADSLAPADLVDEMPVADLADDGPSQAVPIEILELPEPSIPPRSGVVPPPLPNATMRVEDLEPRRPVARPVAPAEPSRRSGAVPPPLPGSKRALSLEPEPEEDEPRTSRGTKVLWVVLGLLILGGSVLGITLAAGLWGSKKRDESAEVRPPDAAPKHDTPAAPPAGDPKPPDDKGSIKASPGSGLKDPVPPNDLANKKGSSALNPVAPNKAGAIGDFDRLGTHGAWANYRGTGFTAEFPGTPGVKTENANGMQMKLIGVAVPEGAGAVVMQLELPAGTDAQLLMPTFLKGLADSDGFKGKTPTDAAVGGRAAKEIGFSTAEAEGKMRLVGVKDRIFLVLAATSAKAGKAGLTKGEIDRFLNSVRITSAPLTATERRAEAAADYRHGSDFHDGVSGPKDFVRAREWWERAALAGHAGAQNDLGTLYHKGDGGPRDYAKAKEWYEKAAAQENANAQNNLGILHEFGLGVTKDLPTALKWYRKGAANGSDPAKKALERLEKGEGKK